MSRARFSNPRHFPLWRVLLALLFAPCGWSLYQTSASFGAQSMEAGTMFEMFDNLIVVFTLLFMVALLPNRAVEMVKPIIHARIPEENENLRVLVLLALSLAFGMATAIVLNLNILLMFPDNPLLASAPHAAGVALTGFLLMFDANVWHNLGEVIQRREEVVEAQTEAARLKG